MTTEAMYDYLMDVLGVSQETMSVVCCINGFNTETMESILYAVTGYRSFEQLEDDLNEEDE